MHRFVDRDMLLCYHWGHGVGHAYSHVTRTSAGSIGNCVFTTISSHTPISDPSDFEPNIDSGNQDKESDVPDDWEDLDNDSNDTESDDQTTGHSDGLKSELDSEEEALAASCSVSLSIHISKLTHALYSLYSKLQQGSQYYRPVQKTDKKTGL